MRIVRPPNRPSRRLALLAGLLLAGVAGSGCGYSFGASGTNLPADAQTIYVERFSNQTRTTGLNDEFMRYLKDEIANHKRLTLVDSPKDADLVLSGALIHNINTPIAFNSVNEPTINQQQLVVRASLLDTRSRKIIWTTDQMSDSEHVPIVSQSVVATAPTFLTQNLRANNISNMTDNQVAQTQAASFQDEQMTNIAQHIYDSMATGF